MFGQHISVMLSTLGLVAFISDACSIAYAQNPPQPTLRVNLLNGSEPGWSPTIPEIQRSLDILEKYTSALQEAEYDLAYNMLASDAKNQINIEEFKGSASNLYNQTGLYKYSNIVKISSGKNPEGANYNGIYMVVDVEEKYNRTDRACRHAVIFYSIDSDPPRILIDNLAFIGNEVAAQIERDKSKAELDKIWESIGANCKP